MVECRGHVWMAVGHWPKAFEDLDHATTIFREQCTGMAQELSYCEAHGAICLLFMGRVRDVTIQGRIVSGQLADGRLYLASRWVADYGLHRCPPAEALRWGQGVAACLDAAQQLQDGLPDLVITDVEMPGMDGFELTRHIRADPRTAQLPVIMITAADDRHREQADACGVSVLLGKPYPEDQLIAHIRQALGQDEPSLQEALA